MVTSYKKAKKDVLGIYEDFLSVREQSGFSIDDTSVKALENQAEKIRADRFCLMIAGEAKSGKSTFINAYLGKEILPMDVKQCTSSVVEIMYGPEFSLNATYADGKAEKIVGEAAIKTFLTENAALDDDYRDIPTTAINVDFLVRKQGKKILEAEIVDLLNGVRNENIHRLPPEEYEKKIRRYIAEKQPHWQSIVVKMVIEYPFDDTEMRGIHIVDSPGVNAAGKVGDVTATYIESADAIMFLKPITGQAIEAISFKNFLESKSVDRNKNAMFLILTRRTAEAEDVIERAYEEYVNMFGTGRNDSRKGIVREQIIPVDSKAELYFNEFQNLSTEEIRTKLKALKEAKKMEPFLSAAWFEGDGEKEAFLEKLKEYSNFEMIDQSLNRFGRKAQFLALSEFLARILKVYEKIALKLRDDIANYELKAEDPAKLAVSVSETKAALTEIENKMVSIVDEITTKYAGSGKSGVIAQEAERVVADYVREVDAIGGTDDGSLDLLEKKSFQYVDKFIEFEKKLQGDVIKECNQALISLSDNSSIEYVTLEPDFSPEVVNKIKEDVRSEATESYTYTTGRTFTSTHKGTRFSQDKFFGLVKNSISERIENIKQQAIRDLRSFVSKTATAYTKELAKNADIKKKELSEIVQRQQTAEEIQQTIDSLKEILQAIEPSMTKVKEYKGGIDSNV